MKDEMTLNSSSAQTDQAKLVQIPLFDRAESHDDRTAIIAAEGRFTFHQLLEASHRVASHLLDGADDLNESRVAFISPPSFSYVAMQWGIWLAGGVVVPLCVEYPPAELEYVIRDSGASIVAAHPKLESAIRSIVENLGLRLVLTTEALEARPVPLPAIDRRRRGMILYTSGTTSKPKGVVTTHHNIEAQITSLIQAWGWTADDRIMNVLPLHHIHGIINVLSSSLWAGAQCEMLGGFDLPTVWRRICDGNLTLFMAVPTIYGRLIAAWDNAAPEEKEKFTAGCQKMRLMICGSAALPVTILEKWKTVSGHVLLERFGMTEIGMGLANPLNGRRVPGAVGSPLPGVEARLVDESGQPVPEGTPGEIQIRGDTVFLEYWNRPEATRDAFIDGWFRTGDIATRQNGVYRILGRNSVDIIKTGGYKVSALEIEEVLRTHEAIAQCAVVGVADADWGERVAAAVILKPGASLDLSTMRSWAKQHLAPYKVPSLLRILEELPCNAMGKVVKPSVSRLFGTEPAVNS